MPLVPYETPAERRLLKLAQRRLDQLHAAGGDFTEEATRSFRRLTLPPPAPSALFTELAGIDRGASHDAFPALSLKTSPETAPEPPREGGLSRLGPDPSLSPAIAAPTETGTPHPWGFGRWLGIDAPLVSPIGPQLPEDPEPEKELELPADWRVPTAVPQPARFLPEGMEEGPEAVNMFGPLDAPFRVWDPVLKIPVDVPIADQMKDLSTVPMLWVEQALGRISLLNGVKVYNDLFFQPMDVFAFSVYEAARGRTPTVFTEGYDAAAQKFEELPLAGQVGLSLVQPGLVAGAVRGGVRGVSRVAFKRLLREEAGNLRRASGKALNAVRAAGIQSVSRLRGVVALLKEAVGRHPDGSELKEVTERLLFLTRQKLRELEDSVREAEEVMRRKVPEVAEPNRPGADLLRPTGSNARVPSTVTREAVTATDVPDLAREIVELGPGVGRGGRAGSGAALGQVALESAEGVPSYARELVQSTNRVLREEGLGGSSRRALRGTERATVAAANSLDRLYRVLRIDESALGAVASVCLGANRRACGDGLRVYLRSWGSGGGRALGRFFDDFDQRALEHGLLTAADWKKLGLALDGVGRKVGLSRVRAAYEALGDTTQLRMVDDLLRAELARGRALPQIRASGDLDIIVQHVNRLTGRGGSRFSSFQDILLEAPRGFRQQLEHLGKAARAMGPGASLEHRLARRSLLRAVGYGVLSTVALNEMTGQRTDFRPIVNGRKNPDFLKVRFGDRRYSLFGPWDALAGSLIDIGTGNDEQLLTDLAPPLVTQTWEFIAGEERPGYGIPGNRREAEETVTWILEQFDPAFPPDAGLDTAGGRP